MKAKFFALLLTFVFLFTCACGSDNKTSESDNTLGPDEINPLLFTANGSEINADMFKYFVYYYKTELESVYGVIDNWDSELQDSMTYWEYVKKMATEWFLYAGAVRSQIIRLGIEITDEDRAAMDEYWNSLCETYGGEEGAVAQLETTYCSKEMYNYIVETNFLTEKCFEYMYGMDGLKVSNEDCADKTAEDGYIMAKHILIMKDSEDIENSDAYKRAESIIVQLDQCSPEELEERFDEIMFSFTEDPGIEAYPEGYLFQEGDMMEEFHAAAVDLEIGEYSGIVETSAGYHIILRIPVNYDVVPISQSNYIDQGYDYYTLRYIIAEDMFQANIDAWIERVETVYTEEYDQMTLDSLMAVG